MPESRDVDEQASFATNAQRWAMLAIKAGFTAVAAGFLIYWVTTKIDAKVDAIAASQIEIKAQNATVVDQMWQLISVGQATCLNVARTGEERRACIAVERR